LRDAAAAGEVDRLYVHSPDRLARKYAHQFLLLEELRAVGVEVVFLNRAGGATPEDELLVQIQGVIAEYERAKITERCRRGRQHKARQGCVSALGGAPYGYRYVKGRDGQAAHYDIYLEEARVVRQMFAWVADERLSLRAVARRLTQQGVPTPRGKPCWNPVTVWKILSNPPTAAPPCTARPAAGRAGRDHDRGGVSRLEAASRSRSTTAVPRRSA
jgi:site-specific DNA recombinase